MPKYACGELCISKWLHSQDSCPCGGYLWRRRCFATAESVDPSSFFWVHLHLMSNHHSQCQHFQQTQWLLFGKVCPWLILWMVYELYTIIIWLLYLRFVLKVMQQTNNQRSCFHRPWLRELKLSFAPLGAWRTRNSFNKLQRTWRVGLGEFSLEVAKDFLERGVVSMRNAMILNVNGVGSCCMPFKSGKMHC